MNTTFRFLFLIFLASRLFTIQAQDYDFQTDFTKEELAARRNLVYDAIGDQAIAVLQGAADNWGFRTFRQTNSFYYLTGFEAPHAYLLLDGRSRKATLYVQHRNAGRERGEGKVLSAEDAELIMQLTGIEYVKPLEDMTRNWVYGALVRPPHPVLFIPHSPQEIGKDSRDENLRYQSSVSNDPWDGRSSREGHFIQLIKSRYPQFEIKDLSPILDDLRNIKSNAEINMIRKASIIAGHGLMEAMRCTRPGTYEYQLEACARFVHQANGARRDGYCAITGGGTNAWMGHYSRNNDALKSGDMVLMDFAPELRYYTSDITRMWPVNGKFSDEQLELYNFVVAYRTALIKQIKPGVDVNHVLAEAAKEMRKYIDSSSFSKPAYLAAVEKALTFRGHMQHPVGMAVHDVGNYKSTPLTPGEVFAVDPMIWVPEEKLYVRVEDVVVVTEHGVENFTDWLPVKATDIEAIMQESSILDIRPPITNPK